MTTSKDKEKAARKKFNTEINDTAKAAVSSADRYRKYIDDQSRKGPQYRDTQQSPDIAGNRFNYATYKYDYFSGAQSKVFFGDIWVDDIITIQFQVNNDKLPIYGYASEYFDAVAKGQVIIQGSLTVAFKEVGYLNIIKNVLDKQKEKKPSAVIKSIQDRMNGEFSLYGRQDAVLANTNFTPDLIRKSETIEQILDKLKRKKSPAFTGSKGNAQDFEDWAEVLEDSIWGDSNSAALDIGKTTRYKLLRADQFDSNDMGGITTARGDNYSNVLNILIAFGDIDDMRSEHTLYLLNDVHFTSQGMIVAPDGNPIAETYNFFARNVNQTLSSEVFNINPVKFDIGFKYDIQSETDVNKLINSMGNSTSVSVNLKSVFVDGKWSLQNTPLDPAGGMFLHSGQTVDKLNPYILETVHKHYMGYGAIPSKISLTVTLHNKGESKEVIYILEREASDAGWLGAELTDIALFKIIAPVSKYKPMNLISREDFFTSLVEGDPIPEPPKQDKHIEDKVFEPELPPNNDPKYARVDKESVVDSEEDLYSSADIRDNNITSLNLNNVNIKKFKEAGSFDNVSLFSNSSDLQRTIDSVMGDADVLGEVGDGEFTWFRHQLDNKIQSRRVDNIMEESYAREIPMIEKDPARFDYYGVSWDKLPDVIKKAEDFRDKVYLDPVAGINIGYGFQLLDKKGNKLNEKLYTSVFGKKVYNAIIEDAFSLYGSWEDAGFTKSMNARDRISSEFQSKAKIDRTSADTLFTKKYNDIVSGLKTRIPGFSDAPVHVQTALVNLEYQAGRTGVDNFKKAIQAVSDGDYDTFKNEVIDSDVYRQTPNRIDLFFADPNADKIMKIQVPATDALSKDIKITESFIASSESVLKRLSRLPIVKINQNVYSSIDRVQHILDEQEKFIGEVNTVLKGVNSTINSINATSFDVPNNLSSIIDIINPDKSIIGKVIRYDLNKKIDKYNKLDSDISRLNMIESEFIPLMEKNNKLLTKHTNIQPEHIPLFKDLIGFYKDVIDKPESITLDRFKKLTTPLVEKSILGPAESDNFEFNTKGGANVNYNNYMTSMSLVVLFGGRVEKTDGNIDQTAMKDRIDRISSGLRDLQDVKPTTKMLLYDQHASNVFFNTVSNLSKDLPFAPMKQIFRNEVGPIIKGIEPDVAERLGTADAAVLALNKSIKSNFDQIGNNINKQLSSVTYVVNAVTGNADLFNPKRVADKLFFDPFYNDISRASKEQVDFVKQRTDLILKQLDASVNNDSSFNFEYVQKRPTMNYTINTQRHLANLDKLYNTLREHDTFNFLGLK